MPRADLSAFGFLAVLLIGQYVSRIPTDLAPFPGSMKAGLPVSGYAGTLEGLWAEGGDIRLDPGDPDAPAEEEGVNVEEYASFDAAVGALGSSVQTFIVPAAQTISSSMTIPGNITLLFTGSGRLDPAKGVTLTIHGNIVGPIRRIFGGDGTIRFGSNGVKEVYLQWFGATGNGKTDDASAINAAVSAMVAGQVVRVTKGSFRITSKISCNKRIDWKGEGHGSEFLVEMDNLTDAFEINNVNHITFEDIAFVGAANSNRSTLCLNSVHRSVFKNVWVRSGAALYGIYLHGSLLNTFISGGTTHEYVSPYGSVVAGPKIGIYADKDTTRSIASNANTFLGVIIENTGSHGIMFEGDGDQIDNILVGGVIEGCAGRGLYLKRCSRARVYGTYLEDNTAGDVLIEGGGFHHLEINGTKNVDLVGTSSNYIEGSCDRLSIDANCYNNRIGDLAYGAFSGKIIDQGKNTVLMGMLRNLADSDSMHPLPPPGELHNIFPNGDLSYWPEDDTSAPEGFGKSGGIAGWTKTGDGQADPTKRFGKYAVKVTIGPPHSGVSFNLTHDLGEEYTVGNFWTCTVWVRLVTPGTLSLKGYYDGGTSVVHGPETSTVGLWIKLTFAARAANGYSDLSFVVKHDTAGASFYIGGVTISRGLLATRSIWPSKNTQEWLQIATPNTLGREAVQIEQNARANAFIDFKGNSEAGVAKNITTWKTGAVVQGFVKQEINGVEYWQPYYSAPTGP